METTLNLRTLNNHSLVIELKKLVSSERKITAEIITYIREVMRRKIYLEYNHTSLFAFLTKEMGYSNASAQRRIEAARLSIEIPEIKSDLESGSLNLSQIALVAQCLKQKEKERPQEQLKTEDKKEIISLIKNKDIKESAVIVAQTLDLEIKVVEKKRLQKDGSMRIELTFNKEEVSILDRAKELISHVNPNPSFAELVKFLAQTYIQKNDPLVKPRKNLVRSQVGSTNKTATPRATSKIRSFENGTSEAEVGETTNVQPQVRSKNKLNLRKPITAEAKQIIFQRDKSCQWRETGTNRICGSKFQLEIDHKHSVWAGGGNELKNLQLLCKPHNALKYRREGRPTK